MTATMTTTSTMAATCSSSSSSFADTTEPEMTMIASTPANTLILEAADKIQHLMSKNNTKLPLDDICNRLQDEFISEIWQLEYLDSYQYNQLGMPMGLVASIRRCLEERQSKKLKLEQMRRQFPPIGRSSNSTNVAIANNNTGCSSGATNSNNPTAVKRALEVVNPSTRSVSTLTLGSALSPTTSSQRKLVSLSSSSCSPTSAVSTSEDDLHDISDTTDMNINNHEEESSYKPPQPPIRQPSSSRPPLNREVSALPQSSNDDMLLETSERSHWSCTEHRSSEELPLMPIRFASEKSVVKSLDTSATE